MFWSCGRERYVALPDKCQPGRRPRLTCLVTPFSFRPIRMASGRPGNVLETYAGIPRMIYKSAWWSVELPPNWRGYPDTDCTTFRAHMSEGGVLQISAARKDTG